VVHWDPQGNPFGSILLQTKVTNEPFGFQDETLIIIIDRFKSHLWFSFQTKTIDCCYVNRVSLLFDCENNNECNIYSTKDSTEMDN